MFGPRKKVYLERTTTVHVEFHTANGMASITDTVRSGMQGRLEDVDHIHEVMPQLSHAAAGLLRQQMMQAVAEATGAPVPLQVTHRSK